MLASLGSVVVAYSGGVDSAYLAYAASRTLGDRAVAVTADSPSYPDHHRRLAIDIAERFALRHEIIYTHEMDRQEYRANPANRCYFCKHELYTHLTRIAAARDAIVIDGNNADDRGDYRPGPPGRARVRGPQPARRSESRQGRNPRAVAPRGPADVGRAGVRVSVVAHPVSLRGDRREAPDDRAGGTGDPRARLPGVRVRHHDEMARVEIARDEMARALDPEIGAAMVRALKALGYRYVTLDLQGYRTGSLNEGLRSIRFPSQTQQRAAERVVDRPQPHAFERRAARSARR